MNNETQFETMANAKNWIQNQLSCPLDAVPIELYKTMLELVYTEHDINKVKAYVSTVNEFMTQYVLSK